MDKQLALVVDASIKLELNVSALYTIFHEIFPQHASFWWKLSLEENNHAALLRAAKEQFAPIGKFPTQLIDSDLQNVVDCNNKITTLVDRYKIAPPEESEAFSVALALEQTGGELHYQQFMEHETPVNKVFRKLNADDKNHAERIRAYMERHAIPFQELRL
jgi:hypothetical protein